MRSSLSFFTGSSLAALPEFAIVLGIMVLVHEFGHFAVAKLCGVRVEAFALGFGKRLFGIVHNGTDYCVNLFPLGGYVKMAAEIPGETTHSDDPGEFQNHPRWQRVLINLAGPFANFVLAFALMTGLFMFHNEVSEYMTLPAVADYISPTSAVGKTGMLPGDRVVHFDTLENPNWGDIEQRSALNFNQTVNFSCLHNGQRIDSKLFIENKGRAEDFDFEKLGLVPVMQSRPIEVSSIPDATLPAAKAGLQPHDLILAIDNIQPHSVPSLLAYMQDQAGKPAVLTVGRPQANGSSQTLKLPITPALTDTQDGKGYRLGFIQVLPPAKVQRLPFPKAAAAAYAYSLKSSRLIYEVLQRLFTRQVSVKALSSPIGIGVQVHEAFQASGWTPIIVLMAEISLNLGIVNLLPFPILDGGTIVLLAIESLLRRDLNPQIKERLYQVAFVCLVLFAAVVIFNDITKYLPTHLKT